MVASFWFDGIVIYACIQKANEGQGSTINLCLFSFFFIMYPLWWVEHGDRGEISKNDLAVS